MSTQTEQAPAPRRPAPAAGPALAAFGAFAALLLVVAALHAAGVIVLGRPALGPGEIDRAGWKVLVLPAAVAALSLWFVARAGRWPSADGRDLALVGATTAVGLLARLPLLPIGVWRDESSTYFDVLPSGLGPFLEALRVGELNPPGYYLVMKAWVDLAGADGIVFKLPSLAFGLVMIPACYAIGRAAGSRVAGLVAAAVIAVSPEAIYYTQEARPYAMAAVLTAITGAALLRALARPGALALAGFALAATALLYTHYTGLMAVGSLAGAGLVVLWRRGDGRGAVGLLVACGAVAALYAPWLGTFLFHLATGTPWTPETSIAESPVLLLKHLAYTLPWEGATWLMGPLALLVLGGIAWGVAALLRPAGWRGARGRRGAPRRAEAGAVLGLSVLGPAVALAAMGYPSRYMFLFLPLAAALFGLWADAALAWWRDRTGRGAPLPALLAVAYGWAAAFAWDHAGMDTRPKSGIATLEARTDDAALATTAFLLAPDYLAPTFGYVFRDRDATMLAFARAERPEYFSPVGYAEIWERPDAIDRTRGRVEALAGAGLERLAFVQGNCGEPMEDRGRMRYARVNELRAWLDATRPRIDEALHPGRSECVQVTTYDLSTALRAP